MTDQTEQTVHETTARPQTDIMTRLRGWLRHSNARHWRIISRDGSRLFEVNMTVGIIALAVLFFSPFTILLILGVVLGYLSGIRIEVVRELQDNTIIDMTDRNAE
jgi:hypothetical protein